MFYIPTERERERLYQKLKGKPILHPSESAQA